MVTKVVCPNCKGNKVVRVRDSGGNDVVKSCPTCNGQGFKVQIVRY